MMAPTEAAVLLVHPSDAKAAAEWFPEMVFIPWDGPATRPEAARGRELACVGASDYLQASAPLEARWYDLGDQSLTQKAASVAAGRPKHIATPELVAAIKKCFVEHPKRVHANGNVGHSVPTPLNTHGEREPEAAAKRNVEVTSPTIRFEHIADMVAKVKPVNWLVKGWLARGTTVCTFGPPDSGKSLHVLDLGLHIAAGVEYLGNRVAPGAVFYLCAEGGEGLKRRAMAWAIRHRVNLAGVPFYAYTMATNLSDPLAALAVGDAVLAIANVTGITPQLVIVDTLSRHLGGDENSTQDMARFVANLDTLVREPTGACVLVVHHTGIATKDRSRGSSVLYGAVDSEFRVVRDSDTGTVELKGTKAKDWEKPGPVHFDVRVVDLGIVDEDGDAVTSAVLEPADAPAPRTPHSASQALGRNQREGLVTLKRLHAEHARNLEADGRDGATARVLVNDWRIATKLDRSRWHEVLSKLGDRGLIQLEGDYVRPVE